ncbi:futalosine hydrolase [Mucilaginibacter achroorhodeus]|uniref:Futalosine hydrolase n=1 Tax=Mucilaginibacter achroorhodeus TaxID=2599294 RepID=A0A563TYA9_9SPHI|nr:futalosine hydrolase [Mucilaginibacter achroorhodeus]TWR24345.1 futalosine hydrolase [Mucilaginibacter achroorhodeus]
MRVLFVAATEFEVGELKSKVKSQKSKQNNDGQGGQLPIDNCQLLITGVGMVATAYALGRELSTNRYDLAVNLGIAGSFDRNIALGEVVEVIIDTLAELGAEDDEKFLPIDEMGFGKGAFAASRSLNEIADLGLKNCSAITVNTVHGNEHSIAKLKQRMNVEIESMEGAAFFYACTEAKVACFQLRSVSNYVEKRNRDNWQIGLAVKNLNEVAIRLLDALAAQN